MGRYVSSGKKDATGDQQLHKICCDASKLALEHIKGMSGQVPMPASHPCAKVFAPEQIVPLPFSHQLKSLLALPWTKPIWV